MAILSVQTGGFIMEPFVMVECVLGMITCFFLVHCCVSNGLDYMARSDANEAKSQALLQQVNEQMAEMERASADSQHMLAEVH